MPENKTLRPQRFSILDSLGRKKTLLCAETAAFTRTKPQQENASSEPSMAHAFDCHTLGNMNYLPKIIIFLGIGPQPEFLSQLVASAGPAQILYCECPDFSRQMLAQRADWLESIPENWAAQSPDQVLTWLRQAKKNKITLQVWTYRQNLALFPEFWGLMLGLVSAARHCQPKAQLPLHAHAQSIVLPGQPGTLLFVELMHALRECGFQPVALHDENIEMPVDSLAFQECLTPLPVAFLSVNLRGLDAMGKRFYLLEALGVPVALWFVDNPWLILSALRSPWWKKATIFVTDPSFVPGLKACGATKVELLPLGASPPCMKPEKASWTKPLKRLSFVGSTSFCEHKAYFAAVHENPDLNAQALHMEENSQSPDFHWWATALGLNPQNLWPGSVVRQAGLGAQAAGLRLRVRWLKAALPHGLSVFGNPEWGTLLGTATHEPVDYYQQLPALYQQAEYTLDIPTLLLPQALNQRHFDVWQAGGFLLSAHHAGLSLFPAELTAFTTLPSPEHFQEKLELFSAHPRLKRELQNAWQEELHKHSYPHRILHILYSLNLNAN